jgi:hypothetical protein
MDADNIWQAFIADATKSAIPGAVCRRFGCLALC